MDQITGHTGIFYLEVATRLREKNVNSTDAVLQSDTVYRKWKTTLLLRIRKR